MSPGNVFQGSFPLANTVTVTIGGAMVGAGLCQINVPALADGDHAVLGMVGTQAGVLLKIRN